MQGFSTRVLSNSMKGIVSSLFCGGDVKVVGVCGSW